MKEMVGYSKSMVYLKCIKKKNKETNKEQRTGKQVLEITWYKPRVCVSGVYIASLPAVVVQSNIFFQILPDDFESNGDCFCTTGESFAKLFLKFLNIFRKCVEILAIVLK